MNKKEVKHLSRKLRATIRFMNGDEDICPSKILGTVAYERITKTSGTFAPIEIQDNALPLAYTIYKDMDSALAAIVNRRKQLPYFEQRDFIVKLLMRDEKTGLASIPRLIREEELNEQA